MWSELFLEASKVRPEILEDQRPSSPQPSSSSNPLPCNSALRWNLGAQLDHLHLDLHIPIPSQCKELSHRGRGLRPSTRAPS